MNKSLVLSAVFAMLGTVSQASVYTEIGDAGSTFPTAQSVTDGTTQIDGFLDATTDRFITDMFGFSLGADTGLTIDATGFGIDTVLFLMDAGRNLLVADDDSGPGVNSSISTTLGTGDYFVAIGDFGTGAFASLADFEAGTPFVDPFISTENGPFSDLVFAIGTDDGPFSDDDSGSYEITFSTAVNAGAIPTVVPLPAGLPLLLAGLGAFGLLRHKRHS